MSGGEKKVSLWYKRKQKWLADLLLLLYRKPSFVGWEQSLLQQQTDERSNQSQTNWTFQQQIHFWSKLPFWLFHLLNFPAHFISTFLFCFYLLPFKFFRTFFFLRNFWNDCTIYFKWLHCLQVSGAYKATVALHDCRKNSSVARCSLSLRALIQNILLSKIKEDTFTQGQVFLQYHLSILFCNFKKTLFETKSYWCVWNMACSRKLIQHTSNLLTIWLNNTKLLIKKRPIGSFIENQLNVIKRFKEVLFIKIYPIQSLTIHFFVCC